MKAPLPALLLCFAMVSPMAVAQTKDEHSAHHPEGQAAPTIGVEAQAQGAASNAPQEPSAVEQGMKRLQELMTRIEQTTDSVEREALLHEHMVVMLEQIKLLQAQAEGMSMAMMMMGDRGQMGMMGEKNMNGSDKKKNATKTDKKSKGGGGMMGGAMMGDGMMGQGMMGMHKMMQKRLDMLQQLLEQSIKHAHMREAGEH
jgi:small-conductance mechanosensitive channel